jgi:hypothetical protein
MWIPGMIALLAAAPSADAALLPLSFETADAITALRGEHAALRQVVLGATEGAHALEITFEPAAQPQVRQVLAGGQDWRASGGLALDLQNPGKEPVRVWVRVDDEQGGAGLTGSVLLAPGGAETVTLPLVPTQGQKGEMRAAPSFPGPSPCSWTTSGGCPRPRSTASRTGSGSMRMPHGRARWGMKTSFCANTGKNRQRFRSRPPIGTSTAAGRRGLDSAPPGTSAPSSTGDGGGW